MSLQEANEMAALFLAYNCMYDCYKKATRKRKKDATAIGIYKERLVHMQQVLVRLFPDAEFEFTEL